MEQMYNMRSPAVKRLMREAQELHQPTEEFSAQPLEDNLFEWHFTVRGPPDTDFDGGTYHGRIILPAEYPMKPPSIILLTPNGRFETNKKICLSISGHHPESWQPSWSIRTALLAIIGFMPTNGKGAIGALDYTPNERKLLARKSQDWKCSVCGSVKDLLLTRTDSYSAANEEAKELAAQISFKGEDSASNTGDSSMNMKNSASTFETSDVTSGATPSMTSSASSILSDHSTLKSAAASLPNLSTNNGVPQEALRKVESATSTQSANIEEGTNGRRLPNKQAAVNAAFADRDNVRHRINPALEITKIETKEAKNAINVPADSHPGSARFSNTAIVSCILFVLFGLLVRRLFWM